MLWKTETGDYKSRERLAEFMQRYADNVEWVKKDKHGFSRTLGFTILGRYYEIIWFHNNCNLFVGGTENRPLQASFTAIYTDTCFPICFNGNDNLTFVDEGKDILRIPLKADSLRGDI